MITNGKTTLLSLFTCGLYIGEGISMLLYLEHVQLYTRIYIFLRQLTSHVFIIRQFTGKNKMIVLMMRGYLWEHVIIYSHIRLECWNFISWLNHDDV